MAAADDIAVQAGLHLKLLFMVRPQLRYEHIFQLFTRLLLHDLLQLCFIIRGVPRQRFRLPHKIGHQKALHRPKGIAVKIHCGKQRLKGIGEDGFAFSAAVFFFPVAEQKIVAQRNGAGIVPQRVLTDELRTQLGQISLGRIRKERKNIGACQNGEDAVSQKFIALVAAAGKPLCLLLMRQGRMRQCLCQNFAGPEAIADGLLQCADLGGQQLNHAVHGLFFVRHLSFPPLRHRASVRPLLRPRARLLPKAPRTLRCGRKCRFPNMPLPDAPHFSPRGHPRSRAP